MPHPEKKGLDLLRDGRLNKSTAFTHEERMQLGLAGLLPYSISMQQLQMERALANMRRKTSDIEKYLFLLALQDRTERLFVKLVDQHVEEIMPLIYTPTVGQACKEFSHIFSRTKGFWITPDDRGHIAKNLENWPEEDIHVIVVTDGQRILGLGDLGANGMGIPIGKAALYTVGAGIPPQHCLPVMLDIGTNNPELLQDPLYIGYPHKRLEGEAYLEIVDEFVEAIQARYPKAILQFEDFLTPNAIGLLDRYRDRVRCFNDDIQGTAAMALAGVMASTRITGDSFANLKIMFLGAGSAATGIADLMARAFEAEGLSPAEARERLWFVDQTGLVVASRTELAAHKVPYAHEAPQMGLMEALDFVRPDVLIGATGTPGTFTQEVVERLCVLNQHPVIFALSNPTSRSECTAEQAYTWSKGKAVFASGSPFPECTLGDRHFRSGQGNNAYIFPGLGLGILAANARIIPDEFFLAAAKTLAQWVDAGDIQMGAVYPRLREIKDISLEIAVAVAEKAYEMGLAEASRPVDLRAVIEAYRYDPGY
jgi:malate dehydrogenase (oxaloacetate-decarboxylating)(NADP+)